MYAMQGGSTSCGTASCCAYSNVPLSLGAPLEAVYETDYLHPTTAKYSSANESSDMSESEISWSHSSSKQSGQMQYGTSCTDNCCHDAVSIPTYAPKYYTRPSRVSSIRKAEDIVHNPIEPSHRHTHTRSSQLVDHSSCTRRTALEPTSSVKSHSFRVSCHNHRLLQSFSSDSGNESNYSKLSSSQYSHNMSIRDILRSNRNDADNCDEYILLSNASEYPVLSDNKLERMSCPRSLTSRSCHGRSNRVIQRGGPMRADHRIVATHVKRSITTCESTVRINVCNSSTEQSTNFSKHIPLHHSRRLRLASQDFSLENPLPAQPSSTTSQSGRLQEDGEYSFSASDSDSVLSPSHLSPKEFDTDVGYVPERTLQPGENTPISYNKATHRVHRKRPASQQRDFPESDTDYIIHRKTPRYQHQQYRHSTQRDVCSLSSSSFGSCNSQENYTHIRTNPIYGTIATNPYVRRRSADQKTPLNTSMCSTSCTQSSEAKSSVLPAPLPPSLVPYYPACYSGQQTNTSSDIYARPQPLRYRSSVVTSIETQTSPSNLRRLDDPADVSFSTVASSCTDDPRGNTAVKRGSINRNSGSRRIIESLCRSAKHTFGSLRRAMSADDLDKSGPSRKSSISSNVGPPRPPKKLSRTPASGSSKLSSGSYFPHKKQRHSSSVALKSVAKRLSPQRGPLSRCPSKTESESGLSQSTNLSNRSSITRYLARSRFVEHHPDGTKTVNLVRPENGPFGFFVTKNDKGLYVSRMADYFTHLNGVVSIGDEVLEIEGLSCQNMSLEEVHNAIGRRHSVTFKIRPGNQNCPR